MTVLSVCRPCLRPLKSHLLVSKRMSGHGPRVFEIHPSNYHWRKFKDAVHFYMIIGFTPMFLFSAYKNVFEGLAELADIPEGYTPAFYEHFRQPTTRAFAKFHMHPAAGYERGLEILNYEHERVMIREIERQVKGMMSIRYDYQSWYHMPDTAKYIRRVRDVFRRVEQLEGTWARPTVDFDQVHDPRSGWDRGEGDTSDSSANK